MMPPDQYWDWYWTNLYYSLLFGVPTMIIVGIGYFIWGWLSEREDETERKEHITRLFPK